MFRENVEIEWFFYDLNVRSLYCFLRKIIRFIVFFFLGKVEVDSFLFLVFIL